MGQPLILPQRIFANKFVSLPPYTHTVRSDNVVPMDRLDIAQLRAGLSTTLRNIRNSQGGWAYRAGKRNRLEPTCWALLALARAHEQPPPETAVLLAWPSHSGWLVDVAGAPPNHAFNAIAALTLLQTPRTAFLADPIISNLIASKGLKVPQSDELRQDNSLQAWSWVESTFSWVEPTAWCLLLLKQRLARGPVSGAAERIQVGEQMLVDRACRSGGWNYGNSNVYGKELPAHAPPTALALLALQDRHDDPVVVRGLQWLQERGSTERSPIALSLSIICLRVHHLPTATQERDLIDLISSRPPRADESADLLGVAMALYALSDGPMAAFTVSTV